MQHTLYKAMIHIMINGTVKSRVIYSASHDDFSIFWGKELRATHNQRMAVVSQGLDHNPNGNLIDLVQRKKKKGILGIYEDETELVCVTS